MRNAPLALPGAGSEEWRQRVGALSAIPDLILHLGTDPGPVLAAAGLASAALADPEGRIPYRVIAPLLEGAALRTGCNHFGLLAGRVWHLRDLGLPGELMAHSPTVGHALRSLVVHQHLNSEGGLPYLLERGAVIDFGYAIYAPAPGGHAQVYDLVLAIEMNVMRELCGDGWTPSEVFLPHARPDDDKPYRQFFKAPLRFNTDSCALRFPSSWLAQPVKGADPARLLEAQRLASAEDPANLEQRTYRALRTLLLHGRSSAEDAAQMLAIHRRTLNRRLAAEGTTFQAVLDQVRFAVARELLADSDVAMLDIAATLGYSGPTPFMRAFHRWTGTTPGSWRKRAQRGA